MFLLFLIVSLSFQCFLDEMSDLQQWSQLALMQASLRLLCNSVAGIHWGLMTHSGQLVMSTLFMRSNQATAVNFFYYWINHYIFFLRSQSYFFSFLLCIFLANPVVVAPPPPLLLPPRAGFNRHVCWLRHEVASCPESATSHVLSLSCTFKKLYLKKEHFHLCFDPGEFLSFEKLLANYEWLTYLCT